MKGLWYFLGMGRRLEQAIARNARLIAELDRLLRQRSAVGDGA